jgi:hypothetical protein
MNCNRRCYFKDNKNYDENDCLIFEDCKNYIEFQSKMEKIYSWQILSNKLVLGETEYEN